MARQPDSKTTPILYSFRRCPYAMRARMALYYAGVTVELREVVLRDKPPALLETSPKGTVPVLLLPDNTLIEESYDIMRWALAMNDPEKWLEDAAEETAALISRNDGPFKKALDRYKYPTRYPDDGEEEALREQSFEEAKTFLKELNGRIEEKGALVTAEPALADHAIFPFIRQFAHSDRQRFESLSYNALSEWLETLKTSPLFKAIMPKFDQWKAGAPPVFLGPDKTATK